MRPSLKLHSNYNVLDVICIYERKVMSTGVSFLFFSSPFELLVPLEPEAKPGMLELAPGRFPSQWTTVPETEQFIRVDLLPHSEQYKLVESLFRQSVSDTKASIASIERVQNPFLWEKYARYKALRFYRLNR